MRVRVAFALALGACSAACDARPAPVLLGARQIELALRHIGREHLPADPTNRFADDPAAARLGQWLFFDGELAPDGRTACATCHDPRHSFADGRSLSQGVARSTRHAPVLWNSGAARWLQWDGSADSLWAQALRPIESASEMGSSRLRVVRHLRQDPRLRAASEGVFGPAPAALDAALAESAALDARPVPGDPEHPHARAWASLAPEQREAVDRWFSYAGKALAAYERRLLAYDAPFDRFARALRDGDARAGALLPADAQRGLALFVGKADCRRCHSGPDFSDGEFHDLGVPPLDGGRPRDPGRYAGAARLAADPFRADGPFSDAREGERALRTRQLAVDSSSWGQFKTPTLRNVALSAPYMHQGQIADLRGVLEFYSTLDGALVSGHHAESVLVPLALSRREIDDLLAFLHTLTSAPLPDELSRRPESP